MFNGSPRFSIAWPGRRWILFGLLAIAPVAWLETTALAAKPTAAVGRKLRRAKTTALWLGGTTLIATALTLHSAHMADKAQQRALEQEQRLLLDKGPPLTVRTHQAMRPSHPQEDGDNDGLRDAFEQHLAAVLVQLVFDSREPSNLSHEPLPLFQVRPAAGEGLALNVTYALAFSKDHGYQGFQHCALGNADGHEGDNDAFSLRVVSNDQGRSWRVSRVALSAKGTDGDGNLLFPRGEVVHLAQEQSSDLQAVFDAGLRTRNGILQVFVSRGKHHYALRPTNEGWIGALFGLFSPYSSVGCLDQADGHGHRMNPIFRDDQNVGEGEAPFANTALERRFGYKAFGNRPFLSDKASTWSRKWFANKFAQWLGEDQPQADQQ